MEEVRMVPPSAKKMMIVSNNRKNAERLKFELESRKICDICDVYDKPQRAIEDLVVKNLEQELECLLLMRRSRKKMAIHFRKK